MQPYKVFQFGLGQIGALGMKNFFEPLSPHTHLGYLLRDSRFSISGVWDIDFNVRSKVSKLLKDKVKICEFEKDIEADIVVISTPPQSHQEIISRVLKQSRVQHIVCEKPLSNNLAVAENLQKFLKHKNISCVVNFPRSIILLDNNWYSRIHKSLNQKEKIFCGIQIIDENDSGLWHAIHLLTSIHKNFSKIEFFGGKEFCSKDYIRIIGVFKNLELEIKYVKTTKLVPRGEIHFFLPDQTIRVIDGFTKVLISKGERYLGWDKTSSSTILQVERIDNSMNSLYSKVYNNLISGKIKSYGVDEAVLTHGLVEKIYRFV